MDSYIVIKFLHILAVIALVGPLLLTPKWLVLYRTELGRSALCELHRLTGIAGWLVLIFGIIMLVLQEGEMLFLLWMQISIIIFLGIQIFDHFWADAREEELEHNAEISMSSLKRWLVIKIGLYLLITLLMVLKLPQ